MTESVWRPKVRLPAGRVSTVGDKSDRCRGSGCVRLVVFSSSQCLGPSRLPLEPTRKLSLFADPPYEKTRNGKRFTEKLLVNEALRQLMEADGIFVLEKRPAEALPRIKMWHLSRKKKYGATEVLILEPIRDPRPVI